MRVQAHFHRAGFSVLELLTVLAVLAVLATIGGPAFADMLRGLRVAALANELFNAVNLTRSEAIRRGARVDLVPAGDGSDWRQGWVVLIDRNRDLRLDDGDLVIYARGPVAEGITIQSNFSDSKQPYLSYNAAGRTRTAANSEAPQFGSWQIGWTHHSRRIVINFLGRPRLCNPRTEKTGC
jgi:type IV fimbrial biogenesis protein FimT